MPPSSPLVQGKQVLLKLEIDFLRRCLAASLGGADAASAEQNRAIYAQIDKRSQAETGDDGSGHVPDSRGRPGGILPASNEPDREDRDINLRDVIQKIALEMLTYGRRRITAELKRRGWKVNGKRVRRIMREDKLLCLRRRKFVVTATDSNHEHPVYPRTLVPPLAA
jgi:hypothetical protein